MSRPRPTHFLPPDSCALSLSAAARGNDLGETMIERVRAVLVTPGGCLLVIRRDRQEDGSWHG
jgi:hypothetical protein